MATWAIGDIHGCYNSLIELLKKIEFDPSKDKLWLTGDIINRGSDSIKTLEYIYSIKDSIIMILGNHEISLIEGYYGLRKPKNDIREILLMDNIDEIILWLRFQRVFYRDKKLGYCIAHAGVSTDFTLSMAKKNAKLVHKRLREYDPRSWLIETSKREVNKFSENLSDIDLEVYTLNSFTKMRFCNNEAILDFKEKGDPYSLTLKHSLIPWFRHPLRKNIKLKIIFGHWATLGFYEDENVCCIDSSCVWGIVLSAYNLENQEIISVECKR